MTTMTLTSTTPNAPAGVENGAVRGCFCFAWSLLEPP